MEKSSELFFSKINHAALDGKGGVMLANALLDFTPVPREVAPPDPARRRKFESDLKLEKMIGSVFVCVARRSCCFEWRNP